MEVAREQAMVRRIPMSEGETTRRRTISKVSLIDKRKGELLLMMLIDHSVHVLHAVHLPMAFEHSRR